jgi:membrane fusion protein (multidrug efflux system)
VSRAAYGFDANTGTRRVEIDLANPEGRLRAGMFARVTIVLETHPNTLTIPASAIHSARGNSYCYRVVEGREVKTAVKVGRRANDVEILEGLAAGEMVVTGQRGGPLEDGLEIEVVDHLPAEGGADPP